MAGAGQSGVRISAGVRGFPLLQIAHIRKPETPSLLFNRYRVLSQGQTD